MNKVHYQLVLIDKQNNRVSKKYLEAYWKSHKVGDVGSLCISSSGEKLSCHMTRLQNYKYNYTMAYDYIREVLFAKKIEEMCDDD